MREEGIDKLSADIAVYLLAEWIAIDHNETRHQALSYMDEAQELADYLHIIGYRLIDSKGKNKI